MLGRPDRTAPTTVRSSFDSPMRFTIVDSHGVVSFGGPGHVMKALAAGCSDDPPDSRALIRALSAIDERVSEAVLTGLSVFDEHCVPEQPGTVARWLEGRDLSGETAFRVVDDATRRASLAPRRFGLVIYNLAAKRIVQVQNGYGALLRADRGRIREDGKPVRRYYRYELPEAWKLLP
jgi:hypothetical protein